MQSRASVLPLIFDNTSEELDQYWFDGQLHTHHYYHLRKGGGFSPYFFQSPLNPVHYRDEEIRPAPGEYRPWDFRWSEYGPHYDYILTRGEPESFSPFMKRHATLLGRSSAWSLYRSQSADD